MIDIEQLTWTKMDGLIPCIIQNAKNSRVLMLGYMNREALEKTIATKLVTFYSRSKNRLWTKGETSGNFLSLVDIVTDCDQDSLLIQALPSGPCCHLNTASCFNTDKILPLDIISDLENCIQQRKQSTDKTSYTKELFNAGLTRMAQKIGEEGVEVALAATTGTNEDLYQESADLIYHLLVVLAAKNLNFMGVANILKQRRG